MWYNSIASASTGLVPNALALFNSRRVAPTVYPGGREQAGRGFAVSIATWRVYRRPGQPGGSFTGRRNAPAFTSASTPALSGKTVERWVDPLGLHFTKTLVQYCTLGLPRPAKSRKAIHTTNLSSGHTALCGGAFLGNIPYPSVP